MDTILAGEIGYWRRVAKTEDHHHFYTSPLSHPPRPHPPSGIHRTLRQATPARRRAIVRLRRAPVHPPLGTRPGVHLSCSPIG
jgi:hypothetical protein